VERCRCCDRPLSDATRVGTWCLKCIDGVQLDVARLMSGTPDDIRANVEWLLNRGCVTIGLACMRVPFEEERHGAA
jgi:hypothetical protein